MRINLRPLTLSLSAAVAMLGCKPGGAGPADDPDAGLDFAPVVEVEVQPEGGAQHELDAMDGGQAPSDPDADAGLANPQDASSARSDATLDGSAASPSPEDENENVDAGPTCECEPGEDVACVTSCGSEGRAVCADDCTIPTDVSLCEPPTERCNGVDDDCDGAIDEELREPGPMDTIPLADGEQAGSLLMAADPWGDSGGAGYIVGGTSGAQLHAFDVGPDGSVDRQPSRLVGFSQLLPRIVPWGDGHLVVYPDADGTMAQVFDEGFETRGSARNLGKLNASFRESLFAAASLPESERLAILSLQGGASFELRTGTLDAIASSPAAVVPDLHLGRSRLPTLVASKCHEQFYLTYDELVFEEGEDIGVFRGVVRPVSSDGMLGEDTTLGQAVMAVAAPEHCTEDLELAALISDTSGSLSFTTYRLTEGGALEESHRIELPVSAHDPRQVRVDLVQVGGRWFAVAIGTSYSVGLTFYEFGSDDAPEDVWWQDAAPRRWLDPDRFTLDPVTLVRTGTNVAAVTAPAPGVADDYDDYDAGTAVEVFPLVCR